MSTEELTPIQKEVMKYLQDHHISDKLNKIVNLLCKARPEDPMGFLGKALMSEAKSPTISKVVAREILDSRGNPTVEVDIYAIVWGEEKLVARSGAPSGASTGSNEALELRDGDANRYLGKGVLKAVANVNGVINDALKGLDPRNLRSLDELLCKLDGTPLKKSWGEIHLLLPLLLLLTQVLSCLRNNYFCIWHLSSIINFPISTLYLVPWLIF